ncbi:spore coat protein [Cohnella sp. REN36]|uniref:spore coat protein n=1 Tax=Cohnella sp. REN36 TaxID=2887347 RepID=UPI001D158CBB|nr:spore coat protein [Cohnella sp. REN36]MCC3374877.1 spore coat protein [Cohnella sp. REN36]
MPTLQPITAKELEYIADSMSNEDLLIKQCTAAAMQCTNPQVKQVLDHQAQVHTQHYQTLLSMLQQHQPLAPTQPQS